MYNHTANRAHSYIYTFVHFKTYEILTFCLKCTCMMVVMVVMVGCNVELTNSLVDGLVFNQSD